MKKDVYEMVTDRIIEQLEQGVISWEKPWGGVIDGAYNRISKKPYSLLNQMLLQHSGEYATFKQWSELGGHIRKGEKAEIVVFWKLQPYEEENADGEKIIKQIPLLRYYNVFHISQVDGVEPKEIDLNEFEPIEEAEKIKTEYMTRENLKILEKLTDDAFYSPAFDYIQVPCKEQYQNVEEFSKSVFSFSSLLLADSSEDILLDIPPIARTDNTMYAIVNIFLILLFFFGGSSLFCDCSGCSEFTS